MRTLALCVLAVAACTNCRGPSPDTPEVGAIADRVGQTVHVEACVYEGSGVALPNGYALTALHVVLGCPVYKLTNVVTDEESVAELDIATAQDLARLTMETQLPAESVRVARAHVGDVVCLLSATPEIGAACGHVQSVTDGRGGIRHSAPTAKGNSGSGLYNTDGDLVGIVVTCNLGDDGKCDRSGGGATAVPAWMVE
jgi:hypothetical protein